MTGEERCEAAIAKGFHRDAVDLDDPDDGAATSVEDLRCPRT
jgi:hypothetical protein